LKYEHDFMFGWMGQPRRNARERARPLDRHRFPTPWSVEEQTTRFIVRDRQGQALAHLYFDDEPKGRSAASLPSPDEARSIATAIASSSVGR
jgi:hypothetical protein